MGLLGKLFRFTLMPFKWLGSKLIDLLAWIGDTLFNFVIWACKAIFRFFVWVLRVIFSLLILLLGVFIGMFKLVAYITFGKLFGIAWRSVDRDTNLRTKKEMVWEAAATIPGKNPKTHRQDAFGNPMFWRSYGKRTPMGWMLDHIWPVSKGGSNELKNIQALQTAENTNKSNILVYRPFKRFVVSLRNIFMR